MSTSLPHTTNRKSFPRKPKCERKERICDFLGKFSLTTLCFERTGQRSFIKTTNFEEKVKDFRKKPSGFGVSIFASIPGDEETAVTIPLPLLLRRSPNTTYLTPASPNIPLILLHHHVVKLETAQPLFARFFERSRRTNLGWRIFTAVVVREWAVENKRGIFSGKTQFVRFCSSNSRHWHSSPKTHRDMTHIRLVQSDKSVCVATIHSDHPPITLTRFRHLPVDQARTVQLSRKPLSSVISVLL